MRRWVLWLALLVSSGCGSSPSAPTPVADAPYSSDPRQALAQAESRWLARGPRNYDFTLSVFCFCPFAGPNTARFEVRDGVSTAPGATAATLERLLHLSSVDLVFAHIRRAVESNPYLFDARYDLESGYPLEYFVNYDFQLQDEEFAASIRDFVAR